MISFLIFSTLLSFSQCYLPSPVPAATALDPTSGLYPIPDTPYFINIETDDPQTPPFSLVSLLLLYYTVLSDINQCIRSGQGDSVPKLFASSAGNIQLRWESSDRVEDRPLNYIMLRRFILALKMIHADPMERYMEIHRKPIRFYVYERRGFVLLRPGAGRVTPLDYTGSEVEGDSLVINASQVNSSVIDR